MTDKELAVIKVSMEVYLETAALLKLTDNPVTQAQLLHSTCNILYYDLEAIRPAGGFRSQSAQETANG